MTSARSRRIFEEGITRGYQNLQNVYGSKSQKHPDGDDTTVMTRLDRRLEDTNNILAIAARLEDANSILEECNSLLKNGDSSERQKNQMASTIKRLILPLNAQAVGLLREAAKSTAPIAGCQRYHHSCEVERKRVAEASVLHHPTKRAKKMSVPMELISEHLKATRDVGSGHPGARSNRLSAVSPQCSDDKESATMALPTPINTATMVYSKPEAVRILSRTKRQTTERRNMMFAMIKRGWAPTSDITLRRLMKKSDRGELVLDTPWSGNGHQGGGRKKVFDKDDVDELVGLWKRGEAHGEESIKNAIMNRQASVIKRSGGVPLDLIQEVSRTTVTNVTAAIANHSGVSLVNKATGKTAHRITSKQSHCRVACLLDMVG